jgi:hypothetical protein
MNVWSGIGNARDMRQSERDVNHLPLFGRFTSSQACGAAVKMLPALASPFKLGLPS